MPAGEVPSRNLDPQTASSLPNMTDAALVSSWTSQLFAILAFAMKLLIAAVVLLYLTASAAVVLRHRIAYLSYVKSGFGRK